VFNSFNHSYQPKDTAAAVGLTAEQVRRVYEDIEQKRKTTRYLHLPPLLVEPIFDEKTDAGEPNE